MIQFLNNLITEFVIKILFKLLQRDLRLPNFESQLKFYTDFSNQNQIFLVSLTNLSDNSQMVKNFKLIKRNSKTGRLISVINANAKLVNNNYSTNTNDKYNESLIKINQALLNSSETNTINIGTKETVVFFIYKEFQDSEHKHWTNFEIKSSPFDHPEFEWEIIYVDEKNYFWTLGRERLMFQVYFKRYQLEQLIKRALNRGEKYIWSSMKLNLKILKFTLIFLFETFLIKLRIKDCLPELY